MSYSERSFAGPDIFGQIFQADACAHCAARDEHLRLKRISDRTVCQFRRDIQPLLRRMERHLEAQDNALLAMHPGARRTA